MSEDGEQLDEVLSQETYDRQVEERDRWGPVLYGGLHDRVDAQALDGRGGVRALIPAMTVVVPEGRAAMTAVVSERSAEGESQRRWTKLFAKQSGRYTRR